MEILELVPGSLTSEVQRVLLRSEGISSNGTFRIEVSDGSLDGGGRDRVDADHDGRYWTSELSANSTSEEVSLRLTVTSYKNGRRLAT